MAKEEVYRKISGSRELREKYMSITDKQELKDFLASLDCAATEEDFMDYVSGVYEGEIDDDAVSCVAGGEGGNPPLPPYEWIRPTLTRDLDMNIELAQPE